MVMENDEEDEKEMQREVREFENQRENEKLKNEVNGCVCIVFSCSIQVGLGGDILIFELIKD